MHKTGEASERVLSAAAQKNAVTWNFSITTSERKTTTMTLCRFRENARVTERNYLCAIQNFLAVCFLFFQYMHLCFTSRLKLMRMQKHKTKGIFVTTYIEMHFRWSKRIMDWFLGSWLKIYLKITKSLNLFILNSSHDKMMKISFHFPIIKTTKISLKAGSESVKERTKDT